jgi:hypothetical protein
LNNKHQISVLISQNKMKEREFLHHSSSKYGVEVLEAAGYDAATP